MILGTGMGGGWFSLYLVVDLTCETSLPGGVCQVFLGTTLPGRLFFRIHENPHTLSEALLTVRN